MSDDRGLPDGDTRPRLLVLTSTYPRWAGDPEPGFVHELSKRLAGRFRVTVLGPHAPGALPREDLDGVEVIRYRYAPERLETLVNDGGIVANLQRAKWKLLLVPPFVLAQALSARRLLREKRIDIVQAHWLIPQGLVAALLQWLPGRKVPFVVTSHGADLYALKGGLLDTLKRFATSRAAAVTVVSEAMRDSLRSLGMDMAKVSVLSMGVDLAERFSPDPAVRRSAREILFVGRLVEKKGLRCLLDAMPAVLRRFPDAFLTIAGFGPEKASLRAHARTLGLESNIRFLGAVPQAELPALYRRAALFVAPFVRARSGDEEGLGLVTLEAIACGCPIVVSALPAVMDVLDRDQDAHLLFPPGDASALADRIIEALASPGDLAADTLRLRHNIVARFDWNSVADRYAALLGAERAAA